MATTDLGVASVHKVLHHKRPHLFPLLDNETVKLIRPAARAAGCGLRQLIHSELQAHEDAFAGLERDVSVIAGDVGGVPLSWLRLHDILGWMEATGQRRSGGDDRSVG